MAAAAIGVQLSIGSVYAWSVYTHPIMDALGWGLRETQFTFSIAIFFLGISAATLGRFAEKQGPSRSAFIAAVLYGSGIAGAGLAIHLASLPLLYLMYGVVGGIGLGLAYITPIAVLVKWFPDKRGLATGLAVMGFGLAAMISGPAIVFLIRQVGITGSFFVMGACYFIIILGSSRLLVAPPKNWVPPVGPANQQKTSTTPVISVLPGDAVKTKRFWYLWGMFFINISCGIAVISSASPLAQEVVGLSPVAAAAMVGFMGIFNGSGRLGWSAISDYAGRSGTFMVLFSVELIAFVLLPKTTSPVLFQLLIFVIVSCYGGGFSSVAAYIGDLFGTEKMGTTLGYMLTAWAAAGMAGPLFLALIKSQTNDYTVTLYSFAGFLGIALVLAVLLRREAARVRAEEQAVLAYLAEEDCLPEYMD